MAWMSSTALRATLGTALDTDPRHEPAPGDRLASVLVPIVDGGSVVFTRRTDELPRHPGEISFPGGIRHDDDHSALATALREAEEELGIAPAEVEVLGALPPVHTFVSRILIVPFVGVLAPEASFRPNPGEIAEVLTYSLDDLVAAETEVEWRRDGGVYRGYAYEMGDHTIWGATAKILRSLLEIVDGADDEPDAYAPDDATLRSILGDARTIAVVGLSSNPHRHSYDVARFLQRRGYRIVPINPNETEVLGERAYPSLLDVPEDVEIDVVDVFRRAEHTPPVAEQAAARGAKVLWLQDGIVNEQARAIAEDAGMTVVMGVCIERTSKRLRA
jgi:predicted CoA-binding protein/8-oxo-dGTP pyrophosphatase MutT (NUDIX family)